MAADFDDAFASDDEVVPKKKEEVKAVEPTIAPEEAAQMAADFDDAFASDDEEVKPVKKLEPVVVKKEAPATPKADASKKKNKKKAKKGTEKIE